MSQPKLTLRPPPNVDFVQGYPGIPPGGPDRPQAAVKGAIEVRVAQQGVKAKWVRIELRKIETLPGGGVANTFFDFVGQSPINLWQSPNDEYSTLHTNDFPFFIRIPESIPPTIALEKGAGIKYELIASVCTQGKKGFLRRDKPIITASTSTIIIDKHELHSTWPIYSQPETRNHSQDGVTLIVERSHTCYGPGDRVVVMATVKSDTLHTVLLRGFEFMLRETTIFRAAPHTQGKKGSPQVKISSIGEQHVPVNATLYGGTQHKVELSVTVPSHHTSATINAARHIDINYVLTVKALMNTGQPIVMDLPVMISNWPRAVSVEAMRRIGHAFNVSLPNQPPNAQSSRAPTAQQSGFAPGLMGKPGPASAAASSSAPSHAPSNSISNSIEHKPSVPDFRSNTKGNLGQYSTAPVSSDRDRYGQTNEFGERKRSTDAVPSYAAQTIGAVSYSGSNGASRGRAGSNASSDAHGSVPASRPRSSGGRANPAQRLTIVNPSEEEMHEYMEAEKERARRQPSTILESPVTMGAPVQLPPASRTPPATKPTSAGLGSNYLSAEKEKELLYERAVRDVQRVQEGLRSPGATSANDMRRAESTSAAGSAPVSSPVPVTPGSAVSSKPQTRWPTAEEEKEQARRFKEAQEKVARARGLDVSASSGSSYPSGNSIASPQMAGSSSNGGSGSGRTPSMSAGASMYQEAMSAVSSKPVTSPVPAASPVTPGSALPSAIDEKAILRKYYEAKNAVYQTQSAVHGRVPGNAAPEPVPYEALYPNQQPISPTPSNAYPSPGVAPPPSADMPPPFAAASGSTSHPILDEKERFRRHFEAQDAATTQQQQPWQPASPLSAPYALSPPPGPYPGPPAMSDPRFSSLGSPPPPSGNPPPFAAPSPMSPATPLSAYEEKEMLKRKYAQQDTAYGSPNPRTTPTPPPPRASVVNGSSGRRPPPTPPISPNAPGTPISGRPLTAAEEKAQLRAMYEAENRAAAPRPQPPQAPALQSPYPSPPPSNGYHEYEGGAPRMTPSPRQQFAVPPPPPLAPKPPKEYIEETRAEDMRTAAKLQAIDGADPVRVLAPDLAPEEDEGLEGYGDDQDHTFGPGTLSALSSAAPSPGPSRQVSMSASVPLSVPPPPPLPPKLNIE